MTPEQATQLREPFPPEQIGKLPRAGTQLDFVGHAAVTDRLLKVDPDWSWEPFAVDENGLPRVAHRDKEAVLWIRLTVAGVTRPGVGIVAASAGDLEKQLISDALRNAAMRFGVAVDLWSREDLHRIPEPEWASEAQLEAIRELSAQLDQAGRAQAREYCKKHEIDPKRPHADEADGLLVLLRQLVDRAGASGPPPDEGATPEDEPANPSVPAERAGEGLPLSPSPARRSPKRTPATTQAGKPKVVGGAPMSAHTRSRLFAVAAKHLKPPPTCRTPAERDEWQKLELLEHAAELTGEVLTSRSQIGEQLAEQLIERLEAQ